MMRALAEFIMRGRLQAGMVAVLGYIIPLLTPATLALVTLRKGAFEGTLILLFGLCPALLSLALAESDSIVVWITLLSLIVVYIPALYLRATISLSTTVVGVMITASLVSGAVVLFAPDSVDRLIESLVGRLALNEEAQQVTDVIVTRTGMSGMIAYVLAFNSFTGVLLGRWLQALLYNPGGFGAELRELRLSFVVSSVCFVGSIILRYQGDEYWWWSNILAIPLLLVAIAIAHSLVKARSIATPWLVLFYFAVFIFTPIVMCIGFVDTWMDFRNRLKAK